MRLFYCNKKIMLTAIFIFVLLIFCTSTASLQQLFHVRVQAYQKNQIFEKLLVDKSFACIAKTKYALLYGNSKDAYTDAICRAIDAYFPLLLADFQHTPGEKLPVFVYDSAQKMKEALGILTDTTPIGVFHAGSLHILNPALWVKSTDELTIKNEFLQNGPIVHELTHYLLDEKTKGNYPVWFTEGVALYYEKKYLNFEWYQTRKLQSGQITYTQLLDFYSLDEKMAYRRSYDIICFLVENFTEQKLQDFIEALAGNADFETVFYQIYYFSPKLL